MSKRRCRLERKTAQNLLDLAFQEYEEGDHEGVLNHAACSLQMFRELRNYEGTCASLRLIGLSEVGRNNCNAARTRFQEHLRFARAHSNERDMANSLVYLALVEELTGNCSEAHKLYREAKGIFEKLKDQPGIAMTLHNLAMVESTPHHTQKDSIQNPLAREPKPHISRNIDKNKHWN